MKHLDYGIHMNEDPDFCSIIDAIAEKVKSFVETGTNIGMGSTLVLGRTGKPTTTIECNPHCYEQAVANLSPYPNVVVLNGYSLKVEVMRKFIENDDIYESDLPIAIDTWGDARKFYLDEIGCLHLDEDLLVPLIYNLERQCILLDSAGGVGYLEFDAIIQLPREQLKQKILVLDDIAHIKHFRSAQWLDKTFPSAFKRSPSGRWGYIDFIECDCESHGKLSLSLDRCRK